ncbi:MAG: hypothetical protein JSV04_02055 [Candidatus Heimdallarchaeota archaeon]|nr:MAG: hypothetical protein JSV04_02055 [Candidatus Heimdallarchaeota archaeon]
MKDETRGKLIAIMFLILFLNMLLLGMDVFPYLQNVFRLMSIVSLFGLILVYVYGKLFQPQTLINIRESYIDDPPRRTSREIEPLSLYIRKEDRITASENTRSLTHSERVKEAIFEVLPDFKSIYGEIGIPIIEIQKKVNYEYATVSDVLKQMIAKHVIKGHIDHRQTIDEQADDLLFLEIDPTFQCEICKAEKVLKEPHFQCTKCDRYICASCHSDMNQVGYLQCSYCRSDELKAFGL